MVPLVALSLIVFIAHGVWKLILLARGTTPGKMLLGMRVIKEDGGNARFLTMLIREWIEKFTSGRIFSPGLLWILFDRGTRAGMTSS